MYIRHNVKFKLILVVYVKLKKLLDDLFYINHMKNILNNLLLILKFKFQTICLHKITCFHFLTTICYTLQIVLKVIQTYITSNKNSLP